MSLIQFDNYPGVYNKDELLLYKVAEITSQLDICLRTLNHEDEETHKIITKVFKSLQETIDPLLVTDWESVDVPVSKSKLYKESK